MAGSKVNRAQQEPKQNGTSFNQEPEGNFLKIEQLLASIPDLYLILTPDLLIKSATRALLTILQRKPETLFGKYLLDVFANNPTNPDEQAAENLQASLQQAINTKKPQPLYQQLYSIRFAPNAAPATPLKRCNILNIPVLDEAGEVEYLLVKLEEATENSQTVNTLANPANNQAAPPERAGQQSTDDLAEERRRMKEAQVLGTVGSFEWNLGDVAVNWSDEMYRINGMEPQSEVITMARINSLMHSEDIAHLNALKKQSFKKPGLYQLEHRIVNPDGTIKRVRQRFEIQQSENSAIVRVHGTLQDITEQGKVRKKLEESQELLHSTEVIAQTGSYEGDLHTLTFRFSDGLFRIFGEEPQSFTPTLDFFDSRSKPEDAAAVREILEQAITHKKPYVYRRRIQRADGEWRLIESHGQVICNAAGKAIRVLGLVQDITERQKTEEQFQESNALLQSVFDTSLIGFSILKAIRGDDGQILDFKIHMVNKAREQQTQRTDLVGRLYAAEYPDIVKAGLFDRMLQVMETGETQELEYYFPHNGFNNWFSCTFVKSDDGLVASDLDITTRKTAELKIQEQNYFIERITQTVPDMISVIELDTRKVLFHNSEVFIRHGYHPDDLESLNAEEKAQLIHPEDLDRVKQYFQKFRTITDQETITTDYRAANFLKKWQWFQARGKVFQRNPDGSVAQILNVVHNITERKKAELELIRVKDELAQQATNKYLELFQSIEQGFCTIQVKYDEHNSPTDYQFMEVSPSFEHQTGIKEGAGKWMRDIAADQDEFWFITYGRVAKTRKAERFEYFSTPLKRWWTVSAFPIDSPERGRIGVLFNDITEQKKAEQQIKNLMATLEQQVAERTQALRESKEQFEAAINVLPVTLSILKSIRNEQQQITDFRFDWVSTSGKTLVGKDITGQRLTEQFTNLENTLVLQKFKNTVESGAFTEFEEYYPGPKNSRWLHWKAVKLEDGLFVSLEDITERKKDEQAIKSNLALLQQSEEVAHMGSWEYDITTGDFQWSRGMYRLFSLPSSQPVSPEMYLEYVVTEDKPIARTIIQRMRAGREPISETLRLRVDGQELTLTVKGIALPDEKGNPQKMLGIDLDISEVKRLEEENLQLRLQQQKDLLLAILEAQEEERRRISESLHNGVGQILYAAQLSLETVHLSKKSGLLQQMTEILEKTESLIKEAIRETRQISHELVPLLLQQFGLEKAIQDFCERFLYTGIQLNCHGFETRLDKHLEVAIYRISQELVNNIAKHAEATQARLEMFLEGDVIIMEAQDNGKGLQPDVLDRKGIGLQTIQDRVDLLGGKMEIESTKGKGTLVTISIPSKGSFLNEKR